MRKHRRVILADNHSVVRAGLRCFINMTSPFRVVGETGDGLKALGLVDRLKPEVLVLDAALPGLYGLEVARRVRERAPKTGVVILATSASPWCAIRALRSGVRGYVVKHANPVELTRALTAVSAGRSYLSAPLSRIPVGRWLKRAQADDGDPYDSLTPREREILQFVAEGHTSADIGRRLRISPRTVEAHRAAVMHKLRVTNQSALIRYALSRGVLPLPEPPHVWGTTMKN